MATYLPMAKGVLIFPRQREKLCAWLTHSTYAFCRTNYPDLLTKPPEARINRKLVAEYVGLLRKTHQDISVATSLHHLRLGLSTDMPESGLVLAP
jgi:hypothetical protein